MSKLFVPTLKMTIDNLQMLKPDKQGGGVSDYTDIDPVWLQGTVTHVTEVCA